MSRGKRFRRIHVEISNICNLQCSFCPEVHRQKKVMEESLFARIIAQAAPLSDEVCLHLMGEPLGHPELERLVAICSEHALPINLTTNGTLLDARRSEILLQPVVRQVNFSVHSFEANFGERDVTGYLRRLFAFTREAMERRPDFYINYRVWDLTDPVSLTATNRRIREALEAEYPGFTLDPAKIDIRRKKGYRMLEGKRVYLSLDSRFEWPSLEAPLRSERGSCHALSNHFGIHADGTVVPCCLDKEAVMPLGNAAERPLEEILASPRARAIVEGFAQGRCVEALCQRCDFIKRFDRKPQVRVP